MHVVDIVEFETGQTVKTIECGSERNAEKVDRGLQINLNHERFYTRVRERAELSK